MPRLGVIHEDKTIVAIGVADGILSTRAALPAVRAHAMIDTSVRLSKSLKPAL